jgi:hypothetical protein
MPGMKSACLTYLLNADGLKSIHQMLKGLVQQAYG